MIFKNQPEIFTDYSQTLPLEVYKIDDHEFPTEFVLSSLTNKFISSCRLNANYTFDLLDYLCNKAKIIRCRVSDAEDKEDSYHFLYNNSIVNLRVGDKEITLKVYYVTGSIPDLSEYDRFKITDKTSRISILIKGSYGLEARSIKVDPIKVDDININYGPDFSKVHENVVLKLNKPQSSIMFFHGPPGCGKSSYIKYLTTAVKKEFIFIPVAFAGELSTPEFMSLLLEHKDSILILEDSEKVVQSREEDDRNVSTVSTLLNISDGILGSMLNIKIVATYNGDKDKVDKALLRPGRLAVDHTFGKLDAATANKLAKLLDKDIVFDKEMSLAEIYNIGEDTGYKEKQNRKIGF